MTAPGSAEPHRLDHPSLGSRHIPVGIIITAIVACWIATQYLAHSWRNHPTLGSPVGEVFHYRIYPPHDSIVWSIRYGRIAAAQPTLRHAMYVWSLVVLVGTSVTLLIHHRRTQRIASTAHGTARWGRGDTLDHTHGLLVGRLGEQPLRYQGEGHLVTIAPTRSGKGISAIIPNLLTYPGSVIVTDPKGENFAVTARRRQELGTQVMVFDPFDITTARSNVASDHIAAYNPLDLLRPDSPDMADDARLLADMLVVVDGKETGEQSFWNEEARALITGILLYVATEAPPELRTLSHVRTLLTLPPSLFEELLTQMHESEAVQGLVARAAHRLQQKAEKERSGVISSAQAHTHFLDSPRMATVLSRSTVDVMQVKHIPTSLFVILPTERFDGYHRWVRLMLAVCLQAVTRTPGPPHPTVGRVVFLLDEFGHLGKLRPIEHYIGLAAGYGASFWLFLQDLSQLKAVYAERWSTFLANADIVQVFGVNDWDTAEYISKMTGEATVFTDSENRSQSRSHRTHGSRHISTAITRAERGRRLLLPDEVRRLDGQLVFVKQHGPVLAQRLCYFASDRFSTALFARHFDRNPMYHG